MKYRILQNEIGQFKVQSNPSQTLSESEWVDREKFVNSQASFGFKKLFNSKEEAQEFIQELIIRDDIEKKKNSWKVCE